jgi:hypothetical protein
MSTCPACGVAVVPGYVRCPKCHAPLPRTTRAASAAGGTSVEQPGGFPILAVVLGVAIAGGIALFFGLRGGSKPAPEAPAAPAATTTTATREVAPAPAATFEPTTTKVDPASVAGELDRALDRQRMWSTVEVVGTRIEVRSGSCGDPNMAAQLDAASEALRSAGLTKLRCVEQSGRVVMDRDL